MSSPVAIRLRRALSSKTSSAILGALAALGIAFAGAAYSASRTESAATSAKEQDSLGLKRVYALHLAQQADRLKYALVRGRRPDLIRSPLSAIDLKVLATSLPPDSWAAVAEAEYSVKRALGPLDPGTQDSVLCRILDAQGAVYRTREALGQKPSESATFPVSVDNPPEHCPASGTDVFGSIGGSP